MTHDLLYLNPTRKFADVDSEFEKNFMIKSTFMRFSDGDADAAGLFINTLLKPLVCAEDIEFRREIMRDFTENSRLLDQWTQLFGRISSVRARNSKLKSVSTRTLIQSTIKVNAETLKALLTEVKSVAYEIERTHVESQGLKSIVKRLSDIVNDENTDRLISLCELFEKEKNFMYLPVRISLNENAKICDVDIVSGKHKERKFKKCERPIDYNTEFKNGLQKIADTLAQIELNIYAEFGEISKQLGFYRCAVSYVNCVKLRGYSLCYPEIKLDNSIKIKDC